ncbi:MAG: copper-binding protein [Pyrinomonadaceae bacterium]|nr:copper-binding protein [Pyrinomonadaceae bacterium]
MQVRKCASLRRPLIKSLLLTLCLLIASCGQQQPPPANQSNAQTPTPQASPSTAPAQVKNYRGVGVVTKVVLENGYGNPPSVELDHEEIVGLMPPMRMEFYVKEKSLISGLKVGDKVDFTIEEKGGTEIISEIKKK